MAEWAQVVGDSSGRRLHMDFKGFKDFQGALGVHVDGDMVEDCHPVRDFAFLWP